jgi:hypothetical protein
MWRCCKLFWVVNSRSHNQLKWGYGVSITMVKHIHLVHLSSLEVTPKYWSVHTWNPRSRFFKCIVWIYGLVAGIPTPLKNIKVSWDYCSQYITRIFINLTHPWIWSSDEKQPNPRVIDRAIRSPTKAFHGHSWGWQTQHHSNMTTARAQRSNLCPVIGWSQEFSSAFFKISQEFKGSGWQAK